MTIIDADRIHGVRSGRCDQPLTLGVQVHEHSIQHQNCTEGCDHLILSYVRTFWKCCCLNGLSCQRPGPYHLVQLRDHRVLGSRFSHHMDKVVAKRIFPTWPIWHVSSLGIHEKDHIIVSNQPIWHKSWCFFSTTSKWQCFEMGCVRRSHLLFSSSVSRDFI